MTWTYIAVTELDGIYKKRWALHAREKAQATPKAGEREP